MEILHLTIDWSGVDIKIQNERRGGKMKLLIYLYQPIAMCYLHISKRFLAGIVHVHKFSYCSSPANREMKKIFI